MLTVLGWGHIVTAHRHNSQATPMLLLFPEVDQNAVELQSTKPFFLKEWRQWLERLKYPFQVLGLCQVFWATFLITDKFSEMFQKYPLPLSLKTIHGRHSQPWNVPGHCEWSWPSVYFSCLGGFLSPPCRTTELVFWLPPSKQMDNVSGLSRKTPPLGWYKGLWRNSQVWEADHVHLTWAVCHL